MTRTFLIDRIGQAYLAVETTGIAANPKFMPIEQYLSWADAESYFSRLGASNESLTAAKKKLDSTGNAPLVVEDR